MERRSTDRHLLLSPYGAPPELLPWLASLVGLTIDERWPEAARRTMLAEAVELFQRRGTLGALRRMLEIYLGVAPILVERFRFRGLTGTRTDRDTPAVLGGGFRVGGALGPPEPTAQREPGGDAFAAHAHRFSVVVRRHLDADQLATVEHLLDLHRPAHTLIDICTAEAGMRVGVGLHLELTSIVGRSGDFRQLQIGGTALGRDAVLGRPERGIKVAASRLGADTRVGS
jgi:phage tail-like protein